MIRRIIILMVLMTGMGVLKAQLQIPMLTLFSRSQSFYNPGSIGNQGVLTGDFFMRQNWLDFGASSTQFFCAHTTLKNPAVAMGLLLERDVFEPANHTGIYLNYAYRINLGENKLSLGLKLGMFSATKSHLEMRDDVPDPTNENRSYTLPNAGFGLHYATRNFWVGLSVPRMFSYEAGDSKEYKLVPGINAYHFFLTTGGSLNVNQKFAIEPSALLIYSLTKTPQFAINVLGSYRKRYKAGLGYRMQESINFILVYNINRQFSLGYSYDMNIAEVGNYSKGSHEIQIRYKFGYKVNASNPRGF